MIPRIRTIPIHRVLAAPLFVFLGVAAFYIATGTYGVNQSNDTLAAAVASWALAVHHTVNLGFLPLAHQDPHTIWAVPGAHGALVTNRFPGAILIALPFYAITNSGYSPIPATVAAALVAGAACALLYRVFLRLESRRTALIGALLFAFATSNWTVSSRELWEHGGASLVIAAGMLAALRRRWTLSGLAFGAAILFRPHLGVGVAVIGLGILWAEHRWRPAIRYTVGALVGLVSFLGWNLVLYGHFTITGGYSDVQAGGIGVTGFFVNIAGTFVSPERGLLICSPVLLVAAFGIVGAWRTSSIYVRIFALAGVAYLISQLWLIRFSGGDGFVGYRTCLESLVWAAPLLIRAGAIGVRRVGSPVAWLLTAFSVAFFAAGAFVQGETNGGGLSPWTHWSPLVLASQYGRERVILGALVGFGTVLVTWYLTDRFRTRPADVISLDDLEGGPLGRVGSTKQDLVPNPI